MALEKAILEVEEENGSYDIPVQFNPTEYNISDSVNYAEKTIPGTASPITQFVAGNASTLNLSLVFDTYDTPSSGVRSLSSETTSLGDMKTQEPTDVTLLTRKVAALVGIEGSLHRPPMVCFRWGTLQFTGVIVDMKQSYTMFMPSGMPVRARVELTFKSVQDLSTTKKESPFESPDRTKFRTIHQGEQLWNYADSEYGDPEKWRIIAAHNGLMNPLDIEPGMIIRLPAL